MTTQRFDIRDGKNNKLYSLAYDDIGNPGDPCPVFCVHGVGHTRHTFDVVADALAKKNRRVIKVDLVGHGASDWADDPLRYYMPIYAQDCAQMIAGLGLRAVDWIGISLGGLVGVRALTEQNVAAKHFVLDDVAPEVPLETTAHLADWFEQINTFKDKESFIAWRVEQMQHTGPLTYEQKRARASYDGRQNPDGTWTDVYDKKIAVRHRLDAQAGKNWDDWALYERISCPTLAFHGTDSVVLTPPLADKLQRLGPKARVVDIEGVGHYPALSDDYQINVLCGFLKDSL